MKILLDNCMPIRFCRFLRNCGHEARHCSELGWQQKTNGVLVRLAAQDFHAMITIDKNMQFQTSIARLELTVFVLNAPSNRFTVLQQYESALLDKLLFLQPGSYVVVDLEP